jgi:WD40 repeat protein
MRTGARKKWRLRAQHLVRFCRVDEATFTLCTLDQNHVVTFGPSASASGITLPATPITVAVGAASLRGMLFGHDDGSLSYASGGSETVATVRAHTSHITDILTGATTEKFATVAGDEIRIWSELPKPLRQISAPSAVYQLLFMDEDHIAFDSADGRVRAYDARRNAVETIIEQPSLAYGLTLGSSGTLVSSSANGTLAAWRRGTLSILPGNGKAATPSVMNSEDVLVFGDHGGAVRRWVVGETNDAVLYRHATPVYRVAQSGDGRWIASTSDDGRAALYDTVENKVTWLPVDGAYEMKFADDQLFATSINGLSRWSLSVQETPHALAHATGGARMMANVGQRLIAIVWGRDLVVVSPEGALVLRHRVETTKLTALDGCSTAEMVIAGTATGEVYIIDLNKQTVSVAHFGSHLIFDVAFSPSCERFAYTDANATVRVGTSSQLAAVPYGSFN